MDLTNAKRHRPGQSYISPGSASWKPTIPGVKVNKEFSSHMCILSGTEYTLKLCTSILLVNDCPVGVAAGLLSAFLSVGFQRCCGCPAEGVSPRIGAKAFHQVTCLGTGN